MDTEIPDLPAQMPVSPSVSPPVSPSVPPSENVVPPSVPPSEPGPVSLFTRPKDLASLAYAYDPVPLADLIEKVWGGSTYGGKRISLMEGAGLFSKSKKVVGQPQTIVTTLEGRKHVAQAEAQG